MKKNLIWWTTNKEAYRANTYVFDEKLKVPYYVNESLKERLLEHRRGEVDHGLCIVHPHFGVTTNIHKDWICSETKTRVGIRVETLDAERMIGAPGVWTDAEGALVDLPWADHTTEPAASVSVTLPETIRPEASINVSVRDDDLTWAIKRLRKLKMKDIELTRFLRLGGAVANTKDSRT